MPDKEIKYIPITCTEAANKLKRRLPYSWDLNIYRGCRHGCQYCYAQYTHKYLGSEKFDSDIYVKTNIAEALERQLAAPGWQREIVNLGGVTDNYQPAEAEYKLMPEVLRLLIKYKTPAIISTKSDLILRDYDLIDELSRVAYVNVAASIITVDEDLRAKLEPGSATTAARFDVLTAFAKTNATSGLHVMPIIPYFTDSYENFDEMFGRAKEADVTYALPGTLYLRGQARNVFMQFVREQFPQKYEAFAALYKTGGAGKEYKEGLYRTVNELRDKHGLARGYAAPMKQKMEELKAKEPKQMSFLNGDE